MKIQFFFFFFFFFWGGGGRVGGRVWGHRVDVKMKKNVGGEWVGLYLNQKHSLCI